MRGLVKCYHGSELSALIHWKQQNQTDFLRSMYHVSMADLPKNGSYQNRAQFPSPMSFCSSATTYLRTRFSKTFLRYFCVELRISSWTMNLLTHLMEVRMIWLHFAIKRKILRVHHLKSVNRFTPTWMGLTSIFLFGNDFSAYYKCFTKGGYFGT